jgi:hypothetical protein
MYRLHGKLVCLSNLVKVTDNNKDTRLLIILPFSVYFNSVMFYSASLRLERLATDKRSSLLSFFIADV